MKYIDITGKKFNSLLVLRRVAAPEHVINKKITYFECLCDCGAKIISISIDIRNGHTKSCGCKQRLQYKNLIGTRNGKLLILEKVNAPEHLKNKKYTFFKCICDCGNYLIVKGANLKINKTNSCGCDKNFLDVTINKKFGKLLVLNKTDAPKYIKDKNRNYFKCICDCGNEKIIAGKELRSGHRTSCGCSIKLTNKDDVKIRSAKVVYKNIYSDGDIDFDYFYKLSQENCYYCNKPPSNVSNIFKNRKTCTEFSKENGNFIYNGLDRIDSSLPHNKNNVVPCCKMCNRMKLNLSINDFKSKIIDIYNFFILDGNK